MYRAAVALAFVLISSIAHAQGVGFVGGGSVDPEQFYVGTFFETPAISRNVRVRPGIDGAWGSGLRVASINLDIIYRTEDTAGWQFYSGVGPSILITRVDNASGVSADGRIDDVTGGIGGLLGLSHTSGFLVEFKVGRARTGSSLKFGAGFRFGGKPKASP